jgi:hypothetical protein
MSVPKRGKPVQRQRTHLDISEPRKSLLRIVKRRIKRRLGEGASQAKRDALGPAPLGQVIVNKRN